MGRQTRERDRQTDASQFTELLECERELANQLSRAQAQARQRADEARASGATHFLQATLKIFSVFLIPFPLATLVENFFWHWPKTTLNAYLMWCLTLHLLT